MYLENFSFIFVLFFLSLNSKSYLTNLLLELILTRLDETNFDFLSV